MVQLSCEGVSIAYERAVVVNQVSFQIEEGDYLCIVGENGSGKTTLIKGILGLVPLKSGQVCFAENTKPAQVGYLPQQTQLQKDFPASVYEVVLSGCLNRRGKRLFYNKEEKQRAEENLERLGIRDLKKVSYRNLSGGQKQRVLLARALCATDKIIFLDEPITGLDPTATADLYQLIEKINKVNGISVVMVSHDIESALKPADKILHMSREGIFFGTKEAYLKSGPGRAFVQEAEHG